MVTEKMAGAALPAGVRVKKLAWADGNPGTYMLVAESAGSLYWAWKINGNGVWSRGSMPGNIVIGGIEAAKAAAQADYEARILSALDLQERGYVGLNSASEIASRDIASVANVRIAPSMATPTQEAATPTP